MCCCSMSSYDSLLNNLKQTLGLTRFFIKQCTKLGTVIDNPFLSIVCMYLRKNRASIFKYEDQQRLEGHLIVFSSCSKTTRRYLKIQKFIYQAQLEAIFAKKHSWQNSFLPEVLFVSDSQYLHNDFTITMLCCRWAQAHLSVQQILHYHTN